MTFDTSAEPLRRRRSCFPSTDASEAEQHEQDLEALLGNDEVDPVRHWYEKMREQNQELERALSDEREAHVACKRLVKALEHELMNA